MSRPIGAFVLLALAACGSGSATLGAAPTPGTTVIHDAGQGFEHTLTGTDPRGEHAMPASAERVWSTLPGAYATLKIPVAMLDSRARLLGNRALVARRQLGGVRLSQYVDCGDRMGMRNADSYEVTFEVGTQVRPVGADSSTLVTLVQGTARSMAVSGDPVRCVSTGELERRIVELVRAELR